MHIDINTIATPSYPFSICTLVTDWKEYEEMKTSFLQHGFADCEFLIADNSDGNKYDAYQAIRRFMTVAQGQYLIICHQDIVIKTAAVQLQNCMADLNQHHPQWALAGNAGGKHIKGVVKHITDATGKNGQMQTSTYSPLPVRVYSLDENFIVMAREKFSAISSDLAGFHFYGTDMCMLADTMGYESYVIDFMLEHKSGGNFNPEFFIQKQNFKTKYTRALRSRFIETTCARLFLSGSGFKNYFYNSGVAFFLVKVYYKFKK